MSKKGIIGFAMGVLLLTMPDSSRAARVYQYVKTVGPGGSYDFTTINAAIVDINDNRSTGDLACIWIYPDEYTEQIHDPYTISGYTFNENCNSLPINCDLRKPISESGEVKIIHSGYPDQNGIYWSAHLGKAGVDCKGNNVLEGLTVQNVMPTNKEAQICVEMHGYGEIINCRVGTHHAPAIKGSSTTERLVVDSSTVWHCKYGDCIRAHGPFSISDCNLHPTANYFRLEEPAGILAYASGEIRGGEITADWSSSYLADAGIFGIRLFLDEDEEVLISDVTIDLKLTSIYNDREPPEPNTLRVCGIMSGKYQGFHGEGGGGSYPGKAVIRNCTINVEGVEDNNDTSDPNDDGADIMVDGICVRGGGTIEVYGCSTSITTSWTKVGDVGEGYEYLLNEEDGTIGASFPRIEFDPTGDEYYHPSKGDIDPLWEIGFRIEDGSGDAVAVFDYCGNLLLKGTLEDELGPETRPLDTAEDDEFIVEDSDGNLAVINADTGDMEIYGSVELDSDNDWDDPDTGQDEFIIHDKDGNPVAYIDESGNVYLMGELYEEYELIEW